MKNADKAELYRELAKLTGADFHLDRSLALLLGQSKPPAVRAWLEHLRQGLAAGRGVAEAVRGFPPGLAADMEAALIEAGERSGRLAQAFTHLARYFASAAEAARKARGALVYPLVLAHVAVVLPEIPRAISDEAGAAGFAAAVLGRLGLLWGGLLALALLWRRAARAAALHAGPDLWLGRVPLLGAARRHWALARFCQVFHSGLLAALRISECCRLAGAAAQSGQLRAGAEQAAQSVERGETLALALAEPGVFEPQFVNAVAAAEESGGLDEEMSRWARAEQADAEAAVDRAAAWLPKAGYALVVVYVVWRIFEMAAGYFGQISRLLETV